MTNHCNNVKKSDMIKGVIKTGISITSHCI